MGTNPKPKHAAVVIKAKCAVTRADTNGTHIGYSLEVERRVNAIDLEKIVVFVGELSYVTWELSWSLIDREDVRFSISA